MSAFSESQKFRQWWLWAIIAGTLLVPLGIVLYDIYAGHKSYTAAEILSGAAVPASIILLFLSFRLDSRIDETGVYYRFFPLQIKMNEIKWEEITKIYTGQYRPLADYGGWGIRYGLKGLGTAYSISGDMGLQVEVKKGRKILIGTLQAPTINKALKQLAAEKKISRNILIA